MSNMDVWSTCLESFCKEYEYALMAQVDFEKLLKNLVNNPDSPLSAILCEFCRKPPFDNIRIGQAGVAASQYINTYELEDGSGTTCKINLWRGSDGDEKQFDPVHTSRRVFELAKCFWKPKMRNTSSGLFSLKLANASYVVNYSLST